MKMIELIRGHKWSKADCDPYCYRLTCQRCELQLIIAKCENTRYWSFPHDEFAGQPLLLTEFFPEENANQLYSCQYRIMCMALTENSP